MKIPSILALAVLMGGASFAIAHDKHDHASHAAAYGQPGNPASPSREIVILMQEADGRMLFVPSLVNVTRGEQIRFRFKNEGVLDHEFLLGTAAEIEEHADLMRATPDMAHDDPNAKRVAPKSNGDLLWLFTQAGEFEFACLIPGHREAGMTGKIVVR